MENKGFNGNEITGPERKVANNINPADIKKLAKEKLAKEMEADNDRILTSGGRVLCVTAISKDLKSTIDKAYEGVAKISFKDMAFRKDIGKKGLNK